MFQDMLRGGGGYLVTWSGEAEETWPFSPQTSRFRLSRRCQNTATNDFSGFSPALVLSILKSNYIYLGTGHYLSGSLQWSNIQRADRLNFTMFISLRTFEHISKLIYVRKNIHIFWCILNKLSYIIFGNLEDSQLLTVRFLRQVVLL